MMAKDDHNIEEAEADRRRHEQIHRGDAGGMVAQKGLPALARRSPTSPHVLRHCPLRDLDAELEQLAMNARRALQRIGKPHLANKIAQVALDLRPNPACARLPAPI